MENLSQYSRCSVRDSIPVPPQYESTPIPLEQSVRSVMFFLTCHVTSSIFTCTINIFNLNRKQHEECRQSENKTAALRFATIHHL